MNDDYLLSGATARGLYRAAAELPICDYHCHLPPREIFEDKVFEGIGPLWLGGDHYKWRLMREAGVPEELVTGAAPWPEKFRAYLGALEFAAGNPLYAWSAMELRLFFGVDLPLDAAHADEIRERCDAAIRERALSPRKLIRQSRVALVATTDDPADSLEWHARLAAEPDLGFQVLPSFRTDRLLNLAAPDYPDYIRRLGETAGVAIATLDDFREAIRRRLDFFAAHGCRISDVGLPFFPDAIASDADADRAFRDALAGRAPARADALGFLGNLYVFLGSEYRARGWLMQLHLGVYRNANTPIFRGIGPDAGCDCIGDPVPVTSLVRVLDAIHTAGGLPQTVLYSLVPSMNAPYQTVAGSYPGVRLGAAWWFVDHRRGIEDVLDVVAETGHLGSFLGMLTDSRSFLSYARHDYFRRILASFVARLVDTAQYPANKAPELMRRISFANIAGLLGIGK